MRTKSIVEIDPGFSCSQEITQGMIGTTVCHSELEDAHKALGIAIIGGGSSPTHRLHKSFLQQKLSSLEGAILLALITMPDSACSLKHHGINHAGHQIGTHMIIESH